MIAIQNLPIRRKLTLVILITCSIVLLLACAALAIFEILDFRNTSARTMTVLADVSARNSTAALAFQDDKTAGQILSGLEPEHQVIQAVLYDTTGKLFVGYRRKDSSGTFPSAPGPDGVRFTSGHLDLVRPVILNDKRIGTIFLQSDQRGMYDRMRLFGGMTALVLLGSVILTLILSARLQAPISRPILMLADTARIIAERKDYSVRAVKEEQHELGILTDAFNQMLTGIEEREKALAAANQSLR
ncbi:MAG TPA: CHASE sensor domain-containing protein, partial [Verrucomicrobiae bacterium]|nr:CHASE sensor domain-containing protein [Verrucomicrobiae bacterium]